jgi:hypothetical protein
MTGLGMADPRFPSKIRKPRKREMTEIATLGMALVKLSKIDDY